MSAPVCSCPLLSAQLNCNLPILLKSLGRGRALMGLITRRSQVQILAPLQSFRVLTARGCRFRRPSFKMRNERGTEQRANGHQRTKSALTALHLRSELVGKLGIRCMDPVWNMSFEFGNLIAWNEIPNQRAGICFSGGSAGGMVKGPTSLANSTGSRRARVAAQYLGASSR